MSNELDSEAGQGGANQNNQQGNDGVPQVEKPSSPAKDGTNVDRTSKREAAKTSPPDRAKGPRSTNMPPTPQTETSTPGPPNKREKSVDAETASRAASDTALENGYPETARAADAVTMDAVNERFASLRLEMLEHIDDRFSQTMAGIDAVAVAIESMNIPTASGSDGTALEAIDGKLSGMLSRTLGLLDDRFSRLMGRMDDMQRHGVAAQGSIQSLSGKRGRGSEETHDRLIDRYVDVLIGTLTGTLHRDAPVQDAFSSYDEATRKLGRDWPQTALTMIGTYRLRNFADLIRAVVDAETEGDILEAGVWRGGACIMAKCLLDAMGVGDRTVWLADSFKGLPPPVDGTVADEGDIHHTFDILAVDRATVEDNFRRFDALDDRVKFVEGFFQDTLEDCAVEKLAILRLDGDMYDSTMVSLTHLYPKVVPGGYVIIDDYILEPCRKAVTEFRQEHAIESPLIEIDGAAVYWKVETP